MKPLVFREPRALPRSSLRAKRRRHRAIGAFALLALFVCAAYGVSYASYLPRLNVSDIAVEGTRTLRSAVLSAYADTQLYRGTVSFVSPTNIFLYPRAAIEEALAARFPRVSEARAARPSLLATAVVISIEERDAFARWCLDEECFLMSDNGFIFAPAGANEPIAAPYVFRGGAIATTSAVGVRYLQGGFSRARALIEALSAAGFESAELAAEEGGDVVVVLARGFSLRATLDDEPDALVSNMQLVLASDALQGREDELDYIDLRFGNRVYYKLNGEEEASVE